MTPPKQAFGPHQQDRHEQQIGGGKRQPRINQARHGGLGEPEDERSQDRATNVADAAEDDDDQRLEGEDDAEGGVEGEKHAEQHATGGGDGAAKGEGQRGGAGDVDRHKSRGRRVDGDRAQREAGAGLVQPQIKPEAERDRADERGDAIEPVAARRE